MKIRPTKPADLAALQTVLEQTELFPPDMLPDMFAPSQTEDNPSLWLTAKAEDGSEKTTPVGFCYTVPEALADMAWNMLAIAVLPSMQDQGVGAKLVEALEAKLAA